MSEKQSKSEIDPAVKNELDTVMNEKEIVGLYENQGGGNEEKLSIVEKWFPNEDEWEGKTTITKEQAVALARARNLEYAFPEIAPIADFKNNVIDDYEMLLTSVEGVSREQQMQVLKALFGMNSDMSEEGRLATLGRFIAGGNEDEEND